MKIKKNVGNADRILRFGASLMMIYFGFFDSSVIADEIAAILLGIFGIIIFVTALISMCPLYNLIGFSTYTKVEEN